MKKIELLAPAGDLEKLKMAIIYGADAVYIGGERFGLRAASKNFTQEEMQEGIKFAHDRGAKVYVTCNIIAHNEDLQGIEEYFKSLEKLGVDAILVADPGFMMIAKRVVPNMELHLSTQANTTNYETAKFWYDQGIKRVVSARELSIHELAEMKKHIPEDMEVEMFVHGAMCISYSGRCLMSNFMTGRDANKGACAQACRWKYALMEEQRPGEYYPVEEDERGTYFFNSKDLCLIDKVDRIIESGVDSMKIEGRIKTAYYVATVVRAYRMAIDAYYEDKENYKFNPKWYEELTKASYRDFTEGFFEDGKNLKDAQNYGSSSYIRNYDFVGIVKEYDEERKLALVEQRNKFTVGEEIEIIGPHRDQIDTKIGKIISQNGEEMEVSNVPMQLVYVDFGYPVEENYIIRRKSDK